MSGQLLSETSEAGQRPGAVISRADFDAVIFDLDGVVTRTAALHYAAWKRLFDPFLKQRAAQAGTAFIPFSEGDYRRFVDGRPRHQGVRIFLESRGIRLPAGSPDDPPERETLGGLGNRKNGYFQEELQQNGPEVFASSIRLIRALRDAGFRTGLVSSSRNTIPIIKAAAIADCFDALVEGVEAEKIGLAGKPSPDAFLLAAERLDVEPDRTVVVEDARAGVEAGRRGRFGLVIGVARDEPAQGLLASGADLVVADLAEVAIAGELLPGLPSIGDLPSALERLDEIARLSAGRRPALFLDYDGTLTPIVRRPEEAILPEAMRLTLSRLAAQLPVAVVSGRDLADVRRMVGLPGISYAGSHGFDIAGPAGEQITLQKGEQFLGALARAAGALEGRLAPLAGVRLERKRFALAVHYREAAPGAEKAVEAAVDEVLAGLPQLRKSSGKKIFEVRPAMDWDKGKAIRWLLSRLGLDRPEVLPLYLGDDLTDEDAFRELRGRGLGIVVRGEEDRPSAARYALADPEEVRLFLEGLRERHAGEGSA